MGVVIRRWVWLESIGVVSGCFPHITYISLLHLYLLFFAALYIPPPGSTVRRLGTGGTAPEKGAKHDYPTFEPAIRVLYT